MLRASLIAIVAVSLAACDDDSETAVEEAGSEVEVAADAAQDETAEAAAETEETTEAAAEDVTEAAEETEETADAAAEDVTEAAEETEETAEAAAGEAAEEGEDVTTLTSDSPAVETTILTEADEADVEVSTETAEDEAAAEDAGAEAEAEDEETQVAAAETEGEPAAGDDPMQRYQEWVQGRWAPTAACDSGVVEMEENALSLPGGISCSDIEIADAGTDSLAITGSSCEGTGDVEELDLEVTQTAEGITVTRGGEEASLVRCE